MAISGDLGLFATLGSHPKHPFRSNPSSSKVQLGSSRTRLPQSLVVSPKLSTVDSECCQSWQRKHRVSVSGCRSPSAANIIQEAEGFLLNAGNMNFFERLSLAWRVLFPTSTIRTSSGNSNANIAKQRLKMILFSDRCAVTEEAKQKIVSNIVSALSDFVEIDSQDKVQLNVSADPNLGTVYSVTVPVRRVKPEYQEYDEGYTGISNIEYKDTGEESGTMDVRFDFFLPNDK